MSILIGSFVPKLLGVFALLIFLTGTSAQFPSAEETIEACQIAADGMVRTCVKSPDDDLFQGERCFDTFIPDCAGSESPLVFDIHGLSSCPFYSAQYTGWKELAEEECFVLVYPLGTTDPNVVDTPCWGLPGGMKDDNGKSSIPCCCSKFLQPVRTDVGPFLRQVAAVTVRDVPLQTAGTVTIDSKRIYMAGHSNGCMTSIYMAAQHSDMVAAVGCHAGTVTAPFPEQTYDATPMAFVHGTADEVVEYDGKGFFLGAETTQSIISNLNECTMLNETRTLGMDNNVTEFASTNCTNNANVILYVLDDVGHFPYAANGAEDYIEEGTVPTKIDTTRLMWDFVKGYSLEMTPELAIVVSDVSDETNNGAPSTSPMEDSSSSGAFHADSCIGYIAWLLILVASPMATW